jgi:hypothetical protein
LGGRTCYLLKHFQGIIVKKAKCALCKETKTFNNKTTKGKTEGGYNKVFIL